MKSPCLGRILADTPQWGVIGDSSHSAGT